MQAKFNNTHSPKKQICRYSAFPVLSISAAVFPHIHHRRSKFRLILFI